MKEISPLFPLLALFCKSSSQISKNMAAEEENQQLHELIPGFPEEIAVECLTRLHYTAHSAASAVNRRWHDLLKSHHFYHQRKQNGHTHVAACLIQSIATAASESDTRTFGNRSPHTFGISLFDSVCQTWEQIGSFPPNYADKLPLFCEITSWEGKLYLMGGWHPDTYEPVTDVCIFDFVTRTWRLGQKMPCKRSLFAIGAINGKILIAGGHDEEKNALDSAWSYDIETDRWDELTRMNEPRDECQGLVIGSEFWVISGYETESQGSFKKSVEVYDIVKGHWSSVEEEWDSYQSPRSCAGIRNKDGGGGKLLFNWAEELEADVRLGTCAVDLGDRTLVSGAREDGAPRGFFLVERRNNDGEYCDQTEIRKLSVPDQFLGFVQTTCCVEI